MPLLTKTDAVVLKSMKYRDTSKIVSFYTSQFGKLKGIAKGARRADNKFGSSLEPLSYVTLVIYKKEQRDLHLISQCDSIRSFGKIRDTIEKLAVGLSILELVDQLAHEEEENRALFSLIVDTLGALDGSPKNVESLGRAFQIRVAALLGYAPSLEVCSECGKTLVDGEGQSAVGFHLANGAVTCSDCRSVGRGKHGVDDIAVSPATVQILRRFLAARIDSVTSIAYGEQIGNELDDILRSYLRYHFDNMKELMSAKIFKSMVK
ncbi:MAG TPA: DNA repair protein RecO [Bacteroidota bacterium]